MTATTEVQAADEIEARRAYLQNERRMALCELRHHAAMFGRGKGDAEFHRQMAGYHNRRAEELQAEITMLSTNATNAPNAPCLPTGRPSRGICQNQWGLNSCPNPAAFIAVKVGAFGFCVMCEAHENLFWLTQPASSIRFEPYTPERERELAARLAALPPEA
jgi:hypothetical protein